MSFKRRVKYGNILLQRALRRGDLNTAQLEVAASAAIYTSILAVIKIAFVGL